MTTQDSSSAIELALRLSGLSRLGRLTCTAEQLEGASVTAAVPFMSASGNSLGTVWNVRASHVSLRLPSAPNQRDQFPRDFEIRLAGGRLLQVRSTWQGQDPLLLPRVNASEAESQLRANGELYTGLPGSAPGVDFLQALDRVHAEGSGSPLVAKEIDALYLLHSRHGAPALPVWVIELRGLPPFPVRGPAGAQGDAQVPAWLRNHMRNVLNGSTGRVLFANNLPQPSPAGELIAGGGAGSAHYG